MENTKIKKWSVTVDGEKFKVDAVDEYTALKAAENHLAYREELKKLKAKFPDIEEDFA